MNREKDLRIALGLIVTLVAVGFLGYKGYSRYDAKLVEAEQMFEDYRNRDSEPAIENPTKHMEDYSLGSFSTDRNNFKYIFEGNNE